MLKLNLKKRFQKDLRLHKTADTLPVIQWFKYHETNDLRWLLVLHQNTFSLPSINKKHYIELQKAYSDILFSMKYHDTSLLSYYRNWKAQCVKVNFLKLKNNIREGKYEPLKISYYNVYNSLYNYLDCISKNYDIQLTEFYIDAEFYSKIIFPENVIKFLKRVQYFYSRNEYIGALYSADISEYYMKFFLSRDFFDNYVKQRSVIETEPTNFAKKMRETFRDYKIASQFFDISTQLFDISLLSAKVKEKTDYWKEITIVKTETHDFDVWNTSLAEYLSKVEFVKAKQDSLQKKQKYSKTA